MLLIVTFFSDSSEKTKNMAQELDEAIKYFVGEHDFKGFKASGTSSKSSVRTIYSGKVERSDDLVIIEVMNMNIEFGKGVEFKTDLGFVVRVVKENLCTKMYIKDNNKWREAHLTSAWINAKYEIIEE